MSSWTLFSVLSVFSLVIGLSLYTAQVDTPEGAYSKRLTAYHNTVKNIDTSYAFKAIKGRTIASEKDAKIYVSKCYAVVYGDSKAIQKKLFASSDSSCEFLGEAPHKWKNSSTGWEMDMAGSLISYTKASVYKHDARSPASNMEIDIQGRCNLFKKPVEEYKFLGCETLQLKK